MKHFFRFFGLLLCAAMLLIPAMASADLVMAAGDLTASALMTSYEEGKVLHLHGTFTVPDSETAQSGKAKALGILLSKVDVDASAYLLGEEHHLDMVFTLKGNEMATVQMMMDTEGNILLTSNLFSGTVLEIPASSTGVMDGITALITGEVSEDESKRDLSEMSAAERLRLTTVDTISLIRKALLGWVAYNQIDDDGLFYTFSQEYVEPTEERDGIDMRMFGSISGHQFATLLYDEATLLDATTRDFQQAVADVLAESGFTRLQVRAAIDYLFPNEVIDPAKDFVQPTHAIPDDGALCTYNDVSYFFKKLVKWAEKVFDQSYDSELSLMIGNDYYGAVIGVDAVLPRFSGYVPYEGYFKYSHKTDDDWQVMHRTHGELNLRENYQLVGDLNFLDGEDVDGINHNNLDGNLSLLNPEKNPAAALDIEGDWTFALSSTEGKYEEGLEGAGAVKVQYDTLSLPVSGVLNMKAQADGENLAIEGEAALDMLERLTMVMHFTVDDEGTARSFQDGNRIELMQMDDAAIEDMKSSIMTAGVGMAFQFVLDGEIMESVQELIQ